MGGKLTKKSPAVSHDNVNKLIGDWPTEANCNICHESNCDAIVCCCSHSFHNDCLLDNLSASSSRGRRCPTCFSIITLLTIVKSDSEAGRSIVTKPLIELLTQFNARKEWKFERVKVMETDVDTDFKEHETSPESDGNKSSDSEAEKCTICMDTIQTRTRTVPCGHPFDFDCIGQWVVRSNKCPVCNCEVKGVEQCQQDGSDQSIKDGAGQSISSLREKYSKRDPIEDLFLPIFNGTSVRKTLPDWRMH